MKQKLQCTSVGDQKYHMMPYLFGMVRKLSVSHKWVFHETKAYPFKHKIFSNFKFISLEEFPKYFYFNFLLWKILSIYKNILQWIPHVNNYWLSWSYFISSTLGLKGTEAQQNKRRLGLGLPKPLVKVTHLQKQATFMRKQGWFSRIENKRAEPRI